MMAHHIHNPDDDDDDKHPPRWTTYTITTSLALALANTLINFNEGCPKLRRRRTCSRDGSPWYVSILLFNFLLSKTYIHWLNTGPRPSQPHHTQPRPLRIAITTTTTRPPRHYQPSTHVAPNVAPDDAPETYDTHRPGAGTNPDNTNESLRLVGSLPSLSNDNRWA